MTDKVWDIAIVGGGPAALSAGIYAARANRDVVIIEKALVGGQQALTEMVENYPGTGKSGNTGMDLSTKMEEQAKDLGVTFTFDNVKGVNFGRDVKVLSTDFGDDVHTKSVIIATGSEPRELGIPGEKELRGKGVSYCATCDGAFFKGRTIVVVGGGNSALEEAMFLTKFAEKVFLVHRRNEFRADKINQDRLKKYKTIEVLLEYVPTEVVGEKLVEQVVLKHVGTGTKKILEAGALFIYVGANPNTAFLDGNVDCTDAGYIDADESTKTNIPGVFGAGDVRVKELRQIVTAVSDGAVAAVEAEKYLVEVE